MNIVTVLVVTALVLTVASLVTGVISMGRGGRFDHEHSTQLMFARVGFQALTVAILAAAFFFLVG